MIANEFPLSLEKMIEDLEKFTKNIIFSNTTENNILSPGMKYKHYAPKAKVTLFQNIQELENKIKNNPNTMISACDGDVKFSF